MKTVRKVPALPPRPRDGHKGTFGTVLVVAGSDGMLGAAILCARGALRGGAGLVRACLPAELRAPFTVAVPCATTLRREGSAVRDWLRQATAVVVGPGLGQGPGQRRLVSALLRAAMVPTVIDADALNLLAPLSGKPVGKAASKPGGRAPGGSSVRFGRAPAVLTPHPGEAGRLLGTDSKEVQRDRRAAAAELAHRSGRVAVLKGASTLVTDGERLFTNRTGNPGMATGGAGDVLSGLLGALLAQGMEPFDAACLAVHVHGKAGDLVAQRISEAGLCADDLPLAIAEVLNKP